MEFIKPPKEEKEKNLEEKFDNIETPEATPVINTVDRIEALNLNSGSVNTNSISTDDTYGTNGANANNTTPADIAEGLTIVIDNQENLDSHDKIIPIVKNGYLTFDINKRYLFDDCDSLYYTKQMNPPPERLMILSLYFITLEFNGEYYALLDYTSYVPGDDDNNGYAVNRGMWTVPHTAIFINEGRVRPSTINEIKNEYKSFMEQKSYLDRMEREQEGLLYNLGLFNPEAHKPVKGREYIEYKKSHTVANQMRCFYIREFFVHDINPTGMLNLVDPEGLHQHFLVPISLLRSMRPVNGVYHFMGRPVPINVSNVFTDTRKLVHSLSCVNKLQASNMLTKVKGILFVAIISDIAGIYNEMKDKYAAAMIEQVMPFILEKCMCEFNVRYYFVNTNKVIGLLPGDNQDITQLFERLYEEITDVLVESEPCILLRCTALAGEFLYGKIFTPCDPKPCFVGEDFEKLCRMADETRNVHRRIIGACNGILFGSDEKDNINFGLNQVKEIKTSVGNFNENTSGMKFQLLYKTSYLEEKKISHKSTNINPITQKILQQIAEFQENDEKLYQ